MKKYFLWSEYFAAVGSRICDTPLMRCGQIICCMLLMVCALSYAATAAAFLDNGVSARSEGLARSFTAVADDLDAFYYNPAGYGLQSRSRANALFTRNRNIENVFYAGYGARLGAGYAAVNLYSSAIDDIPETFYQNDRVVDTGDSFEAADRAVIISYGYSFGEIFGPTELGHSALSLGLSLKYIQQNIYTSKAAGAGLDIGLLYKNGPLSCGWSIINLLEPQIVWDTGAVDVVERKQRFGVAYTVWPGLLVSGEVVAQKNDVLTGLGAEYTLLDMLSLRAGTFTDHQVLGLGFAYAGIHLDYAYLVPLDYLVEPTQKISLGYIF